MRRSVISTARSGCKRDTAERSRSFSEVPAVMAMEPAGEDVRGGVEMDAEKETGVEGCSGAEAVALGSKRRESWELAGEGD